MKRLYSIDGIFLIQIAIFEIAKPIVFGNNLREVIGFWEVVF